MAADRGFTLLEVLVAAVIAALAVAGLLRAGLGGVTAVRAAGQYEEAVAIARSRLALAEASAGGGQPADATGRDGPYAWHTHVAPIATAERGTGMADFVRHSGEARATLYSVGVAVSWGADGRSRQVRLDGQHLGFAPPVAVAP